MPDDDFEDVIKTGPATRWHRVGKSADGTCAVYSFDRGDGKSQYLVKWRNGGKRQYPDWNRVSKVADWRTSAGGRYVPAGLVKSGSLHPLLIDFLGKPAKRLMDSSESAIYGSLSETGRHYRLALRRADGSIAQLPGQFPVDDIDRFASSLLSDSTDGTLDPKQGNKPFSSMRRVD